MKKIILLIIILIFLTGCSGLYNLSNFVIPDDLEFIALIKELDTPERICNYMKDNFIPMEFNKYDYDPYEMWKIKTGDCNDYSNYAKFCAHYNGWKVYQIYIRFRDCAHIMNIYKITNGYLLSDWDYLHPNIYNDFNEILEFFIGLNSDWTFYKIYDYDMNIVEQGHN